MHSSRMRTARLRIVPVGGGRCCHLVWGVGGRCCDLVLGGREGGVVTWSGGGGRCCHLVLGGGGGREVLSPGLPPPIIS